jgi:hypothetical protein
LGYITTTGEEAVVGVPTMEVHKQVMEVLEVVEELVKEKMVLQVLQVLGE